jgi:hypothetical protein
MLTRTRIDPAAFLVQLLGLESDDAQLPVRVLINLHRAQLRVPFETFVRIIEIRNAPSPIHISRIRAETLIKTEWPWVNAWLWKDEYPNLQLPDRAKVARHYDLMSPTVFEKVTGLKSAIGERLAFACLDAHQGWLPLLTLHRLTWADTDVEPVLRELAAQLNATDEVPAMILAMASGDPTPWAPDAA